MSSHFGDVCKIEILFVYFLDVWAAWSSLLELATDRPYGTFMDIISPTGNKVRQQANTNLLTYYNAANLIMPATF